MYARDMAKIRRHGLANANGLVDVITFTLLTIQQPLSGVAKCFADVAANGAASVYLFGSKRGGYAYAVEHKEVLFAAVSKAIETDDVVAAVDVLACVPGLGIVKAAFVAQMLGLEVACLDRHNLARLGLAEDAFKLSKSLKPETRRAKISRYVAICSETGGSEFWWNSWCRLVAINRRSGRWTSASAVSAYHWQAMGIAA